MASARRPAGTSVTGGSPAARRPKRATMPATPSPAAMPPVDASPPAPPPCTSAKSACPPASDAAATAAAATATTAGSRARRTARSAPAPTPSTMARPWSETTTWVPPTTTRSAGSTPERASSGPGGDAPAARISRASGRKVDFRTHCRLVPRALHGAQQSVAARRCGRAASRSAACGRVSSRSDVGRIPWVSSRGPVQAHLEGFDLDTLARRRRLGRANGSPPLAGRSGLCKSRPPMIFRPRDRDALLVSLLLPLTTFAILCYEIVLTRLFAFVFTYDLTAMAVSFAIFGLGAGAYVRVRWLCLLPQRPLAVVAHLASTVSLLALYVLLLFTHATAAVIFVSAMPFAVAGVAVSHYYEVRRAHRAAATYALDLSGAAAACVASAVLLVGLGVDGALLFLAGLSVGGPPYVLCVLLFALLLYCGLGSLVSARFARGVRPRLGSYAIVV